MLNRLLLILDATGGGFHGGNFPPGKISTGNVFHRGWFSLRTLSTEDDFHRGRFSPTPVGNIPGEKLRDALRKYFLK